ncbi:hypothetical protein AVO44_14855 [Ruegeria profundi]|uniref:Uncharacterized protein n=1 Tax=Ruegeria profundi TaxID=1685378 RepID=A0A0X3TYI2_9RHOB|nr:hypothetical protein AVO44_14855 [Ruegeria profundi]
MTTNVHVGTNVFDKYSITSSKIMASVLFSAMRNEAPFVAEWVSYHRAIGFDRIVVVTNDCSDGTDEILDQLSICDGVEHIAQEVPQGVSPQENAVAISRQLGILQDGDWGMFLDADEFLNIKLGDGRLEDLIQYLENKGLIGMLINWRIFGDNHHERFPGAYLSEDYVLCEGGLETTQFKTFFKKCAETVGFSKYLHLCELAPDKSRVDRFASSDGEVFTIDEWTASKRYSNWFREWPIKGESPAGNIIGVSPDRSVAQINHYMVRDPYSFHLKSNRGRGYQKAGTNNRHTTENYQKWNHNSAKDASILRWKEKTREVQSDLSAECCLLPLLDQVKEEYDRGFNEFHSPTPPQFPLTFPGQVAACVEQEYKSASSILEYGSGGSTLLAARLGKHCISVESDSEWTNSIVEHIEQIETRHPDSSVHWVNIGKTREWGFPVNNRKFGSFWRYPMSVWTENESFSPDCVLVDGRMRKACFLTVLAMTKKPVRILFDDYYNRKRYHDVETLVKPSQRIKRMAVFDIKPGAIDIGDFPKFLPWFFDLW